MPPSSRSEILRRLPQIDELLRRKDVRRAGEGLAGDSFAVLVRECVADLRRGVLAGAIDREGLSERLERLPEDLRARIAGLSRSTLRPVVNATGIIVHTNLGRAPLARGALERMAETAAGYSTLEYDVTRGARGSRGEHMTRAAARLFPGRALHAVNNNAAALLLVLNTFAQGREVVISRGELVEIGGSFRIPEIMARSGALLREVGTTNRTRVEDYAEAVNERTGLILQVHASNYRIVGFTSAAGTPELAALGRERGLPVVVDQGSGCLHPLSPYGIPDEPTVSQILEEGADVVLFSGDKLLGGPQAGLIVGAPDRVRRCRDNHLSRALRLDKTTLAGLEWTLQRHAAGRAERDIPVLKMLSAPAASIARRARRLATAIRRQAGDAFDVDVTDGGSLVGGGAAPLTEIPTKLVGLAGRALSADEIDERLRLGEPPVVARVRDGRVLLDPRTLLPGDERVVVRALGAMAAASGGVPASEASRTTRATGE